MNIIEELDKEFDEDMYDMTELEHKQFLNDAIRRVKVEIKNMVKENNTPYMFTETEKRFFNDLEELLKELDKQDESNC